MKIIVACITITLSMNGCMKINHIDPAFREYVISFNSAAQKENGPKANYISVQFSDLGFSALSYGESGICNSDGTIQIDRNSWNISSNSRREEIIYHELGHCVLGRKHLDDSVSDTNLDTVYKSVMMHRADVGDDQFKGRRSNYLHELFHEGVFDLH